MMFGRRLSWLVAEALAGAIVTISSGLVTVMIWSLSLPIWKRCPRVVLIERMPPGWMIP